MQDFNRHNIKYVSTPTIVFQEVPDEISLCFYISNCPHHCDGCHSQSLGDDIGVELQSNLDTEIIRYSHIVTCILFMGGDDAKQVESLKRCLARCRELGFKIALYSGSTLEQFDMTLLPFLDYLKVGPYIKELGGLSSTRTNQRLYTISNNQIDKDITYKFYKTGGQYER